MLQQLLAVVTVFAVWRSAVVLYNLLYKRQDLPIFLRGPTSTSWLLGNQAELVNAEVGSVNNRWRQAYGNVYRMQTCLGIEWLMLNDPNAIQHVLMKQTTVYHLESSLKEFLRVVTGKGLIYADGLDHARQRKMLQPAFKPSFTKSLVPQFVGCAFRLVKQWQNIIDNATEGSQTVKLDVYEWVERFTMEVIGQTAFGVRFYAIEGEEHPLMLAYQGFVSKAYSQPSNVEIVLQALALQLPPSLLAMADRLPFERIKVLRNARETGFTFSKELIAEYRKGGDINEHRNILSVLVTVGEPDLKGKIQPMTDEEIYAQLTTFFIAGYETSANSLCFALYELARNEEVQDKLYAEISTISGNLSDEAFMEAFSYSYFESMPYIAAFLKEALRHHPAVAYGLFQAGKDDIIPLSKPIQIEDESKTDYIPIKKGQKVFLSFSGVNTLPEIWGSDANDFRPERWLDMKGKAISLEQRCGGPYANLSNFGGGPKACPGWQYAVAELQSVITVLIRNFKLSIPDGFDMYRDGCFIVTIPTQKGHSGPSLPLMIERRKAAS